MLGSLSSPSHAVAEEARTRQSHSCEPWPCPGTCSQTPACVTSCNYKDTFQAGLPRTVAHIQFSSNLRPKTRDRPECIKEAAAPPGWERAPEGHCANRPNIGQLLNRHTRPHNDSALRYRRWRRYDVTSGETSELMDSFALCLGSELLSYLWLHNSPFHSLYSGSYKPIPKRNYNGASGYRYDMKLTWHGVLRAKPFLARTETRAAIY